jgi:EAL domain-containing protein (putative c-di-GMP-specific phosphodiesterase class I)
VSTLLSAHGADTLSLQPHHEIERLCANLAQSGAGALLLIDIGSLANIERHFGDHAHRRAVNQLAGLVSELAREAAPGGDVLMTEDRGGDAILAFLFRSRNDREFYDAQLPELSSWISQELTHRGKHAVYPYRRDSLALPVGFAVLLHNPNVNPERQIREAVEAARHDAQLEAALAARSRSRRLLQLILTGDLGVLFEPIVSLRSSEVIGYEALARGPIDTHLRNPRALFQQAKAGGLVYELDCLCRRTALERACCLPRDKKLFLNLLPISIGDPDLRDEGLVKLLENYQLRPSNLVLEISEKESIENFAIFREMRDSWRELGIQIAIDDAGAGYASLEAIMEITPDFLKADMGLVRGIDADPPRQEVLRALKAVARRIGAAVIAEGIETHEELGVLRQLGIPYGQGYHFGPGVTSGAEAYESD